MRRPDALPTALAASAVALFAASPAIAGSERVHAAGELTAYTPVVPAGARAAVDATYDAGGHSHIELRVAGLAPRHRYVARVRNGGCTAAPAALGPIFQLSPNPDPATPDDPFFRNPVNEVWLDVDTDSAGSGRARVEQPWQFHPLGRPGSVTIHEMLPMNHPSDPVVGRTLACLDVAF